jgi:hypothetical protein
VKQIAFAGRGIAALALIGSLSAFVGSASAEFDGITPGAELQPYNAGPVEDAYEMFVMSKAPAPAWAVADGGYGSQGFHHGLPTTGGSDVFAVNMLPYLVAPEAAAAPQVEPVAGGVEAMRDASIFTYTPDADYGSRGIEHWLPQYRQD